MDTTLDAIEAELADLQQLTARIAARELHLIAAADTMQAPYLDGARTLGEWVARRCDLDRTTANRLARTAIGLTPEVRDRLEDGSISVDRAHAYTQAALNGLDLDSLDGLEVAGVWHLLRRRRAPKPVDRSLIIQPALDQDHYRVTGRLGATQGALVTKALEAEMDRLTEGVPQHERPSATELRADALTSLCEGGERRTVVSVHRSVEGTVEVDGVQASDGEAGHAECAGQTEEVRGDTTSRARSTVTPAQRRRVLHRDQHRCSIDGCTSRYRLETHHIIPRSQGGPHADANLATLCWFHHHIAIHRRGMTLDPDSPPGRRRLRQPHHRPDP